MIFADVANLTQAVAQSLRDIVSLIPPLMHFARLTTFPRTSCS